MPSGTHVAAPFPLVLAKDWAANIPSLNPSIHSRHPVRETLSSPKQSSHKFIPVKAPTAGVETLIEQAIKIRNRHILPRSDTIAAQIRTLPNRRESRQHPRRQQLGVAAGAPRPGRGSTGAADLRLAVLFAHVDRTAGWGRIRLLVRGASLGSLAK